MSLRRARTLAVAVALLAIAAAGYVLLRPAPPTVARTVLPSPQDTEFEPADRARLDAILAETDREASR